MAEVRLIAEPRTEFGKGAARRTRRAAKVPAVLYGHGTDPRHLSLPGHELMLALKTANVLLSLDLGSSTELALPKQVQRDPVRGSIKHVDLVLVRSGEKVVVDVAVTITGEVVPDGMLNVDHTSVQVETEATHIPTGVSVDVTGLAIGGRITAGEIVLPAGTTLVTDPDALVVGVTGTQTEEQLEAELAEAEAEVGIVHEPTDAEEAAVATEEPATAGSSDS
jgi:large subunit ribosomal protein L25